MHQEFVEKLQATPRRVKPTSKTSTACQSKSKRVFTNTLPKQAEDNKASQDKKPTLTSTKAPTSRELWQQLQRDYHLRSRKIEHGQDPKLEPVRREVVPKVPAFSCIAKTKSPDPPSPGLDTGLGEMGKEEKVPSIANLSGQRPKHNMKDIHEEGFVLEQLRNQTFEVVPATVLTLKSEADQGTREEESHQEELLSHANNTEGVSQVSLSLTQFVSHDATTELKKLLNLQEHEEAICLKSEVEEDFAETSVHELDSISLSYPIEPMMHLFLAQGVEFNAGTEEATHREVPPQENLLLSKVQNQRTKEPMVTIRTSTKGDTSRPDQSRGVILSYLLKGEPPDVPNLTKPQAYRGKTLNSQRRMKANLLSLGTGYTVSRSKPFQEGEYDVDIRSSSDQEHVKDQRKLTKTFGMNQPERTEDIGVFLGAYQPNQEALSYKTTCSRKPTHQGSMEKKNWFNMSPEEGDIQLTSQWTSNDREGDQRVLIEEFQSNQAEPSCEPTCYGNLTHHRCTESWIHVQINYGLKVIQLLNQKISNLPYLEAHGFKRQQIFTLRLLHDLEVLYTSQRVLRHHLYLPKLSRYKGDKDIGSNNSQDQEPKDHGFRMPWPRASSLKEGFYKAMKICYIIKNPKCSRKYTSEEADIQGSSHDPGLKFKRDFGVLSEDT